ncbi:MAG: heavy metal translocating P-type ATPase [Planctomycetaceae bacterium]
MTSPAVPPACDYCGLPAGGPAAGAGEPRYCCYGCRFAASITAASGDDAQARWMMTRLGLAVFFSMNVMVFTMLLWSQPEGESAGTAAEALYGLARHACLLFTAPVLVLLGGPLLADAVAEFHRGTAAINTLLVAGVAAAFGISAWNTWRGAGHVYFEVSCMVLVAVTLGRWLEASGKLRTTAALRDLRKLLPDRVRLVNAAGERDVDLATVRPGDRLRILPGERLPTDGTILAGEAAIDEQAVTGESIPVTKRAGDTVHSGTLDLDGALTVVVTAAPGSGTLEQLIDAVSQAANAGSREQRLADRVAGWFLPLVLLVAVVTFGVHWRLHGIVAGTLAGLAVVVVSCPCALGLATPMALWAAIGRAARRHVLVRDGDAFAALARARLFCFDKTGTITSGCRVSRISAAPSLDDARALALAAALARDSTHVLAAAIVAEADRRGVAAAPVAAARTVAGCGVEAVDDAGRAMRLGSERWAGAWPDGGAPQCVLALGGDSPAAAIWFAEAVRPDAAPTLEALRSRGAGTLLLSGDRRERAEAVAADLGMRCEAPLLPQEKLAAIEAAKRAGTTVVMVGDGINDAPALAAADVGVALGCGADVSRWSADVCLLRDSLADLSWLLGLADRTRRTIRWNLLWAFGYNAACIPAAAAGWVHPAVAAAAMVASSLFVVAGSLQLAGSGEVAAVPPPAEAVA